MYCMDLSWTVVAVQLVKMLEKCSSIKRKETIEVH